MFQNPKRAQKELAAVAAALGEPARARVEPSGGGGDGAGEQGLAHRAASVRRACRHHRNPFLTRAVMLNSAGSTLLGEEGPNESTRCS